MNKCIVRMEQLVARATRWSVSRFGRLFGWLVTRLTPRLLRVASSNGSANVSQQRQAARRAGRQASGGNPNETRTHPRGCPRTVGCTWSAFKCALRTMQQFLKWAHAEWGGARSRRAEGGGEGNEWARAWDREREREAHNRFDLG